MQTKKDKTTSRDFSFAHFDAAATPDQMDIKRTETMKPTRKEPRYGF